jgi:DNA ligase-1
MRFKPMLAYPVSSKPINYEDKVFMQPKLDGVRCLIQAEKLPFDMGYEPVAYSRTGKLWKNINHILADLKPFFQKYPDVVLDGELYNHDLRDDFETIISLVRRQKPDDIDMLESRDMVQFHCYDYIPGPALRKAKFDSRIVWLKKELKESYCVKHLKTMLVKSEDQAKVDHARHLDSGYEGSIVRLNTEYQNKRSHSLRKFKDFHDAEAQIIGYETGAGKREGTLGKFIMQDENGIQFGCPPGKGFTYKDMADMLNNINDYIGETATFTYFERTKAGSYRHPLFKCIRNYE